MAEKDKMCLANAKEKNGTLYTWYRGLAQVINWVNLKHIVWIWRNWQYGNGKGDERRISEERMAAIFMSKWRKSYLEKIYCIRYKGQYKRTTGRKINLDRVALCKQRHSCFWMLNRHEKTTSSAGGK